jgi:hypothetical protein
MNGDPLRLRTAASKCGTSERTRSIALSFSRRFSAAMPAARPSGEAALSTLPLASNHYHVLRAAPAKRLLRSVVQRVADLGSVPHSDYKEPKSLPEASSLAARTVLL